MYRDDAYTLADVHDRVRDVLVYFRQENLNCAHDYKQRTGITICLPDGAKAPPIWFRGHENHEFKLTPNILRAGSARVDYDSTRLAEETRSAQFSARVTHLVNSNLNNAVDWQEITQHYGSKTRLLDWSESLYTALLIALEPHLANPQDKRFTLRAVDGYAPHIWMLNPVLLNFKVYKYIVEEHPDIIERALAEFATVRNRARFMREMRIRMQSDGINRYLLTPEYASKHALSGIISLSALEALRANIGSRMLSLLQLDEFNPFFYMLLRVYSDKMRYTDYIPPLAILHPYHSPRIEKQRGAFTILAMPPVQPTRPPRPIEDYPECDGCLAKIELHNVQHMADELLRVGQTRAELYPEPATYAEEFEWGAT
jgi:hypothetical protein